MSEAREYLADPILRERLMEITGELVWLADKNAERITGYVDAMKLRSSMTLFHRAGPGYKLFSEVLGEKIELEVKLFLPFGGVLL